ncbi:MAG TPA: chorismate pyruvate-lyase family protein [Candidatus Polarisedimenticolia bacterium]|jgi:chorismate-pyruvate lyase|nr:chorismate pyruvate-lyase family protein [Candidatus Polarisedimenticolia bacterium]
MARAGWIPPQQRTLLPEWAVGPRAPKTTGGLRDLDPMARVLATTDGTVTEILEAWADEPIEIGYLDQELAELGGPIDALEIGPPFSVLRREIVLRGARTGEALLHAESLIAIDRLPRSIVDGLLLHRTPIGRLLRASRLETYREILQLEMEAAGLFAGRLGRPPDELLVSRTYRVIAGGLPVMLIHERFPRRLARIPTRA